MSKKQMRDQIEREVERFIDHGGSVTRVERGVSGRDDGARPYGPRPFEPRPRATRTPVPEVVAAIERRRAAARRPTGTRPRKSEKRPVRRLIYDEFGEPLRYEWRDE